MINVGRVLESKQGSEYEHRQCTDGWQWNLNVRTKIECLVRSGQSQRSLLFQRSAEHLDQTTRAPATDGPL
jgi:hypothetical protein